MQKTYLSIVLAVAAVLCGCDKQTQANTQKIGTLSEKMIQLQETQARQLAAMQAQLATLPATLDRLNEPRFARSHDEILFYHTNNLQLFVLLGKNIQNQFQAADLARESDAALTFYYHTNETDLMFQSMSQITDAMASQEKRMETQVNAETRRAGTNVSNALTAQIKLLAEDKAEAAQRQQMAADIARLQSDLDQIKARLGITNGSARLP